MTQTNRINCRLCRHYYITWEPRSPHGCRAFGFKGRQMPSLQVLHSSGRDCQLFTARPAPRPHVSSAT